MENTTDKDHTCSIIASMMVPSKMGSSFKANRSWKMVLGTKVDTLTCGNMVKVHCIWPTATSMLGALKMIRDTEWDISLILRLNPKLEKNGFRARERILLRLQALPINLILNWQMKDITSRVKEMLLKTSLLRNSQKKGRTLTKL